MRTVQTLTVLNISKQERAMQLYTLFQTFQDRFTVKPVLSDHLNEDNKISFQDRYTLNAGQ